MIKQTTFGFCFTSLFFWRLQDRPGTTQCFFY